MKIIIVGAGKVGRALCRDLDTKGNDVVIIEERESVLNELMASVDINGIAGNGASYDILDEAGTAEADVFIATTQKDEVNVMACIIAKKMGAAYTIARVRNPEYSTNRDFMRLSLGINVMFNPDLEAARAVENLVLFPQALSLERFARGQVSLVAMRVDENSSLIGLSLAALNMQFQGKLLVALVERGEEVIIPSGDFSLQSGDILHFSGDWDTIGDFAEACSSQRIRKTRSVLIIGAGRLTYYMLRFLQPHNMETKVIELQRNTAMSLATKFPKVDVIYGDGSDQDLLDEEGIGEFDCVIASTGIDEENLLISMYARSQGVPKCITKVNRTSLLRILDPKSYGSIITPKDIVADIILRDVRALKQATCFRTENLYRLAGGRMEALEFFIRKENDVVGISLKSMSIPKGTLVLAIIRDDQVIYPDGNDCLLLHDRVIIVTDQTEDLDLESYLRQGEAHQQ